jgi:MFS family permease
VQKKFSLLTVFLVVFIDLMGFGIVLPLLPFYAAQFNASAVSIGLLYSIYSLAQLVFSPIWGAFSDRVGRRPVMILSALGTVLAYLLFAFSNSLFALFASRLLAGIMGGNISTAQAYVADITTHKERARGMGLIGAAFGIGFTAGPAIAAVSMHLFSNAPNPYLFPGLFAAGFSFASFLLVLFKLPESVDLSKKNDPERISRTSLFTGDFWKNLRLQNQSAHWHVLPLLFLSVFLLAFGQSSLYSAFPLFCKKVLELSPQKVGTQFVIMGLIAVIIQGGMIRPLEKRFGEKKLFILGSVLMALGLGLIPFARSEAVLTLFLSLMAVGGSLNGPTLTSLVSKEAAPSKMGATMGSSQSLSALGRVVGPTWGGALFAISTKLPFIFTAAILSLTWFVGLKLSKINLTLRQVERVNLN